MYKPNFCAECGAQVSGGRPHFWSSRRFCASCAGRFRKERFLPPLIIAVTLFGVGLAAGRMARPAPPPLVVERGPALPLAPVPPAAAAEKGSTASGSRSAREGQGPSSKGAPAYGPDGTERERPTDPDEVVSICGARTKKGAPCQRRVRGTGRCWQHRGMPAMLPPSKLIVQG